MPELPEVETIARTLREGCAPVPSVVGQIISGWQLTWKKTLATPAPEMLDTLLIGQKIKKVSRQGKFLILHLTNIWLVVHLRMSGDLRVESVITEIQPHDRFWLDFKSGYRLVFNDPRKFGRVWATNDLATVLGSLGIDPFSQELDGKRFHQMLQGKQRALKPLLLDQTFLAGIGNIYSDEALFRARLHPLSKSNSLNCPEAHRLLDAIRQVLELGIEHNGASIDWVYRGGDFQNHFQVYGRPGEACPRCGKPLIKIRVGQRGTHLCPNCQKKV